MPAARSGAALFHLINSAGEAGASLLLTSRSAAADWRIGLPDLALAAAPGDAGQRSERPTTTCCGRCW